MNRWSVEHVTGTAGELHQLEVDWSRRSVRVNHITSPAIVLGSAQVRADVIDDGSPERSGSEVVTRRSGGGVVLLAPGDHVWLDVVVPRDDPLWDDDVSRAGWWLGEAWAAAITELGRQPGVDHVDIHRRGVSDRVARAARLLRSPRARRSRHRRPQGCRGVPTPDPGWGQVPVHRHDDVGSAGHVVGDPARARHSGPRRGADRSGGRVGALVGGSGRSRDRRPRSRRVATGEVLGPSSRPTNACSRTWWRYAP